MNKELSTSQKAAFRLQQTQDIITRSALGIFMYLVIWSVIALQMESTQESVKWVSAFSLALVGISLFRIITRHFALKNLKNRFASESFQLGGVIASSSTWGLMAACAHLDTPLAAQQELILLCTVGLTAGGSIGFSPSRLYTNVFLVCMLLPMVLVEIFVNHARDTGLLLVTILFMIGMSTMMIRPSREYTLALESNLILQELSQTDALTGLSNRRSFNLRLAKELARYDRHGTAFAMMLIDIDHFKDFNDSYGHLVGDDCLRFVAKKIKQAAACPAAFVARYGGEEFALILPGISEPKTLSISEKIRENVEKSAFYVEGHEVKVTISVGVLHIHSNDLALDEHTVISGADQALYKAKEDGRNRVELTVFA